MVTSLAFDDACSVLISSSEDTVVYAWLLSELLDTFNNTDNMGMMTNGGGMNLLTSSVSSSSRKALYSWIDHTLPVRAVAVGGGKAPCVVSVGDDRRMIIHSLASGQLLFDVALPCQILTVVIDRWEHAVYAGGVDGTIYTISLLPTATGNNGNTNSNAVVPPLSRGLKGHTGTVTCLAVSIDGMHLISGSEDKSVRVWELQSSQCVRIINAPCKGPVSGLIACLRPSSLPSTGGGGNSISSSSRIGSGRKGQHGGGGGPDGGGVAVPLATLNKYPGAPSGKLKAWEGPTIVLHGTGDRMVGRSGDGGGRKGVEGGRKEVVVASDDGSEVEALRLKVGKLEKNVQELAQMNSKLVNMIDNSD
jgi:pre-rRNA-processing protein IPI3